MRNTPSHPLNFDGRILTGIFLIPTVDINPIPLSVQRSYFTPFFVQALIPAIISVHVFHPLRLLGSRFNVTTVFPGIMILPIIKIRWSWNRLWLYNKNKAFLYLTSSKYNDCLSRITIMMLTPRPRVDLGGGGGGGGGGDPVRISYLKYICYDNRIFEISTIHPPPQPTPATPFQFSNPFAPPLTSYPGSALEPGGETRYDGHDRLISIMGITLMLRRRLYIETSSGSYADLPFEHMVVEYWHADNTRTTFTEEKITRPNWCPCLIPPPCLIPTLTHDLPTYPGPLRLRHNEQDGISNHQALDCLLKCLFRRRPKETSKRRVTGLCDENSPVTGEFPAQRVSNTENVSIWWRHHALPTC